MTQFANRVPRIHRLKAQGISATRVTRAAGTPMVTYGTESIGMASTHLLRARRLVAKAVAPTAGGKSPHLILYTADSAGGTLHPAFDAHVLPLQFWALAHWQQWQPTRSMSLAIRHAQSIVLKDGRANWALVAGPAAAAPSASPSAADIVTHLLDAPDRGLPKIRRCKIRLVLPFTGAS